MCNYKKNLNAMKINFQFNNTMFSVQKQTLHIKKNASTSAHMK